MGTRLKYLKYAFSFSYIETLLMYCFNANTTSLLKHSKPLTNKGFERFFKSSEARKEGITRFSVELNKLTES
jgi:hypothetical protein